MLLCWKLLKSCNIVFYTVHELHVTLHTTLHTLYINSMSSKTQMRSIQNLFSLIVIHVCQFVLEHICVCNFKPFSDNGVGWEATRGVYCVLSANTRWLCALLVVLKSHSVLLCWSCFFTLLILQTL